MNIIRTAAALEELVSREKSNGNSIGFVPTMGALHEGHLSLVERCVAENDISVVSVFVNPTQFNNPNDLATYPRDEESDFRLLAQAGVTAVFAPSVEEMYPGGAEKYQKEFSLGNAAVVMEGKYRPGHFQGVALVVSRLFAFVRPDRAYFGEKDFQQIAVIRKMVELEKFNIEIVDCPIKRHDDGLAMSSRNVRLTAGQRSQAPAIWRTLKKSVEWARDHSLEDTRRWVTDELNAIPGFRVEYYEIVDPLTMQPLKEWSTPHNGCAHGCITCYVGDVRLIDNIKYER